jgi:hypothetical protein
LSFRSRETLFIPTARWQTSRRAHYRRLHLPQDPAAFLEPLIERAKAGVLAVSKTAAEGILRVPMRSSISVMISIYFSKLINSYLNARSRRNNVLTGTKQAPL